MSLAEVKKLLFPFRPVRVHTSDGKSYRAANPQYLVKGSIAKSSWFQKAS